MRLVCTFLFYFISLTLFSQIIFPKDYFRLPVNINFEISSNLGEIRPNHYHAGLDVSTQLKSGIKYYSVADGYISRIKVSPRGYGNAIYITHPNGYVSVYGHMSEFRKDIADYIYRLQHNKQQFEQDVYPLPHVFPLKKGDYFGKSGNSGRSYGAHLHFEIREEDSEIPVNPLHVYNVKDKVSPKVNGFYMYRFDNDLENHGYIKRESFKSLNGRTIRTFGKTGFGLEIHDYMSGNGNRFGVYQVDLFVDDSLYFSFKMDKISFYESRYINSFIDYKERLISNKKVTKCFIEPNNQLKIYQTKGSGLYDFSDGKLHKVKIVGKDIKGNAVSVGFKVLSDSTKAIKKNTNKTNLVKEINCFKEDTFSTDSFKIVFHKNCLYNDIDLKYFSSENKRKSYSKLYYVHDKYVPIHNKISIAIKPDSIPERIKNMALIVGISRRGNLYSVGGKWKGDFLEAKIRNFGAFYVTVDTIVPSIRSLSMDKYKRVKRSVLSFKIADNLSGIDEYIGYIDNKWVLFKYDEKSHKISCNLIEEKIKKGKHNLVLWVKDVSNNIASYETSFTYL